MLHAGRPFGFPRLQQLYQTNYRQHCPTRRLLSFPRCHVRDLSFNYRHGTSGFSRRHWRKCSTSEQDSISKGFVLCCHPSRSGIQLGVDNQLHDSYLHMGSSRQWCRSELQVLQVGRTTISWYRKAKYVLGFKLDWQQSANVQYLVSLVQNTFRGSWLLTP